MCNEDYTAKSITVAPAMSFDYNKVEVWASQYKRSASWISRGIETYRLAGLTAEDFKARYLDLDYKDRTEPLSEELYEISKEIQLEEISKEQW